MAQNRPSLAVLVPTRSRPVMLSRCLTTLAAARRRLAFPVYVCDSSPSEEDRAAVREVCARYDWVVLNTHEGRNVPAARNACARAAKEELLVNVDDDLQLEPKAIEHLLARYEEASGRRIVAGSVSWGDGWTAPIKTRAIGYGRRVREGESPNFVIGAFFIYPRSFALAWPWNERIDTADDIFMGAVWRSHDVQILFAPDARALHPELPASADSSRIAHGVHDQQGHIYSLLFDALIANPDFSRALAYETLGFLASARLYLWKPRWALPFLRSWIKGHTRLLADRRYLRAIVRKELPANDG